MNMKLVELVRELFKDEVVPRRELGLPEALSGVIRFKALDLRSAFRRDYEKNSTFCAKLTSSISTKYAKRPLRGFGKLAAVTGAYRRRYGRQPHL